MNIWDKRIWLIADFHFGHRSIINYCNRPFKDVSEMNTTLIRNYNKVVDHNDIVYILGDLSFLNTESTTQIVKSLKGFKFLIKGNHDRKSNSCYRKMGFMEVYDKPILLGNSIILSHEPVFSNLLNIHGHIHNNLIDNKPDNICVSVECINYTPISLQKIALLCE